MATTTTYITSNRATISVVLAGVTFPSSLKSWKSFQGGDPKAATSILLPGGAMTGVAVPGAITRSNVTVITPYTAAIDALISQLEAALNGAMSGSYTPFDTGKTTTRTGLLSQITYPEFDSENSKPTMLGLVMECDT
jgi:hypothetical protein